MKTPPPKMKPRAANPTCPFTPFDADILNLTATSQVFRIDEAKLLPFGQAAKAIFVKANGLPAYYKSTGAFRYARHATQKSERNQKQPA